MNFQITFIISQTISSAASRLRNSCQSYEFQRQLGIATSHFFDYVGSQLPETRHSGGSLLVSANGIRDTAHLLSYSLKHCSSTFFVLRPEHVRNRYCDANAVFRRAQH